MTELHAQWAKLPALLAAHVQLTFLALLLAALIGIPLGVLCARRREAQAFVLGVVGVLQTIPSLALLAAMVALLSSFGFWPALLALLVYSLLPILRGTVGGITSVNEDVLEAATALGMSGKQRLLRVELPLAAPLIVSGLRTATVWAVGTATLSTPVGQPSLGNFIFAGLQTRNFAAVIVGCLAAAALALVLDGALGRTEAAFRRRRAYGARAWSIAIATALLLGALAPGAGAVSTPQAASRPSAPAASDSVLPRSQERVVRVGSKAFTEQYVLAAAIARLLERSGFRVDRRESLGSSVAFDALRNDSIDVYVDYSGTLWSNVLGRKGAGPAWRVLDEVCGTLAERFRTRCLGPLGFENAYAFAMRSADARRLGVRSLDDLAKVAGQLRFGTDLEFLDRPEWARVQSAYALRFREVVPFDPTFMYDAVSRGDADVISAFSSDARIEALGLTVLDDARHALPPYDAVLLLGPSAAGDGRIEKALLPVVRKIDVQNMRRASLMVDRDKRTPDQAAAWLLGQAGLAPE